MSGCERLLSVLFVTSNTISFSLGKTPTWWMTSPALFLVRHGATNDFPSQVVRTNPRATTSIEHTKKEDGPPHHLLWPDKKSEQSCHHSLFPSCFGCLATQSIDQLIDHNVPPGRNSNERSDGRSELRSRERPSRDDG